MNEFRQSMLNIAAICARKEVQEAVLSPGSRSAPLALAFLRHPQISCRTIVDERSAAFVGLGMAQQTRRPVALVCTSGTAALNYAPAVAEAFYQQIPLLVFTADRPPEWIAQDDGQTIVQPKLYEPYCNASYELPLDDNHPDAMWHFERIISAAINRTLWPVPGPVHVNVPLREPLYPDRVFSYPAKPNVTNIVYPGSSLDLDDWQILQNEWHNCPKKLIIAGLFNGNEKLRAQLQELQSCSGAVVLADIASNCNANGLHSFFDMVLGTDSTAVRNELRPDLLVTFGGPIVSKHLKLFLRELPPAKHWHIQVQTQWPDPFQFTSTIIPQPPDIFFGQIVERIIKSKVIADLTYQGNWQKQLHKTNRLLSEFMQDAPHCELSAMAQVLDSLPQDSHLQLGNSSIIRLASLVSLGEKSAIRVNSNRGTCGIDGTVSTAVGAALVSECLTTLVTGDLAFFYDRNGLWHSHLPDNLRIIIFNNHGGGIFRILEGSRDLPELEQHFEVEHNLTAENVAKDHGLAYTSCSTREMLARQLPEFFKPKNQPAIIEVQFEKKLNAKMFLKLKSMSKRMG